MGHTNESLYDDKVVLLSGSLVERYNRALDSLGIERTNLQSFAIDSYGWSPQIAEEKKNQSYLSHGQNIPYGIIITFEQATCSILNPYHSFDKKIIREVYTTHEEKIKSMTMWTSIIITIQTNVQNIQSPFDFLTWRDMVVTCSVPFFIQKGKQEQDKLVENFYQDDNFLNDALFEELLVSGKAYGDLRDKEFSFEEISCYVGDIFYTNAFGGIFSIRKGHSPIMVFEAKNAYNKWSSIAPNYTDVYHIDNAELTKILKRNNVLSITLNEPKLQELSNAYLASTIAKSIPEGTSIADVLANSALKQKYNDMHNEKLQRYREYKKVSDSFLKISTNDLVLLLAETSITESLYIPHVTLSDEEQSAIWQLLTDRDVSNLYMLYTHNRCYFEQLYKKWPKAFQVWVMSITKEISNKQVGE